MSPQITLAASLEGALPLQITLIVITGIYAVANLWMAFVMREEAKIRTDPVLGLGPPSVVANSWQSLCVKQEVTNVGLAFLTLESAVFKWHTADTGATHETKIMKNLPCHLAPGTSRTLEFEIGQAELAKLEKGQFTAASQVVRGVLTYTIRGVTGTVKKPTDNAPLPTT